MMSEKNYRGASCIDCGVFMRHAHGSTKRCPDCKKAFNLIRESDYYKANIDKIKEYQRNYRKETTA